MEEGGGGGSSSCQRRSQSGGSGSGPGEEKQAGPWSRDKKDPNAPKAADKEQELVRRRRPKRPREGGELSHRQALKEPRTTTPRIPSH
ncbi:hypothetical protein JD844_007754 [Phrynosoma platyrhinos]|uniref:Uncharacterized protein n=1 Tax=Phrynosoma platyrhinos TaxID=52577 RepID=A0ABQ7T3N6_PHRPL|nr:hypothetical protein JD844_007754 [Phrynosoma platyrhinos]